MVFCSSTLTIAIIAVILTGVLGIKLGNVTVLGVSGSVTAVLLVLAALNVGC